MLIKEPLSLLSLRNVDNNTTRTTFCYEYPEV